GRPSEIRNDPKVIAAYLGEESKQLPGKTEPTAVVPKQPQPPLLTVERLAAGYGGLEVIRDIDLTVEPGEIVACVGPNGAGKTTTLRAISGMIHHRGRVTFRGKNISSGSVEAIAKLGMVHVPEGRGLFPNLSVEDTLRLVSNTTGEDSIDLAPAFQLFPKLRQRRHQAVGTLSGGEQQMVALARAILSRPRLVMIDEMSQGLAPTVVRQLFDIVRVFREEEIAVLLVEQFVESALDVADRAYVFEHGTIGMSGSAAELRGDRKLMAGSYLGSAIDATAVATSNGNGHLPDPALMEIVSVKVPAKVKRALEQRAETEGRSTGALAIELLGKVDHQ
ncbi:MAG TPA: ATP-binding cassette domain-containing protein, partial [Candidatus Dormibacteraeota bacterium]|nr:ATP-binding cassette domain-containing protein [Candidatus Dormibacteraeota bacterium]